MGAPLLEQVGKIGLCVTIWCVHHAGKFDETYLFMYYINSKREVV